MSDSVLPRQDALFVVNFLLGIFSFIAIYSFHPADPSFYQFMSGYDLHNLEGLLGAHLASSTIFLFGYGAYLLPWVLFFGAYRSLFPSQCWQRHALLGSVLSSWSVLALMSLHLSQVDEFPMGAGGFVGDVSSWQLASLLDVVGTTLILFGCFTLGMTLCLHIQWAKLFSRSKQPTKVVEPVVFNKPAPIKQASRPDSRPILAPVKKEVAELSQDLLSELQPDHKKSDPKEHEIFSRDIEQQLSDFGIKAQVVNVLEGPVIIRYEIALAAGTKVSRIITLSKDIARSLSVPSVRVVDVIPGKSVIGLEFPNKHRQTVSLKELIATKTFKSAKSPLTIALGKGIGGEPVCADIVKMPHLLVAGTTGSGKSVFLNALLLSLLYKSSPEELRLILIDPKMLELSAYSDIPHLLSPVVTDMEDAAGALRWCVAEMERRYQLMAKLGVRNIAGYNEKVEKQSKSKSLLDEAIEGSMPEGHEHLEALPYIVVIADEFADMIMVVGKKVEQLIARLAQKARAAGIHIVLATQRPSVDVITGLIKANIPGRISFQVSTRIDSRTVLDQQGAEQLLGYGDMLYLPSGSGVPTRVHGAYVSDEEVHKVVKEIRKLGKPEYIAAVTQQQEAGGESDQGSTDDLYQEAVSFVRETKRASISGVQRKFRIGYNRAANLVEEMEQNGVVTPPEHNGQRQVVESS
jgi:S-DNA-T family DNA segregation ATPase FtsK/SpoIIIE